MQPPTDKRTPFRGHTLNWSPATKAPIKKMAEAILCRKTDWDPTRTNPYLGNTRGFDSGGRPRCVGGQRRFRFLLAPIARGPGCCSVCRAPILRRVGEILMEKNTKRNNAHADFFFREPENQDTCCGYPFLGRFLRGTTRLTRSCALLFTQETTRSSRPLSTYPAKKHALRVPLRVEAGACRGGPGSAAAPGARPRRAALRWRLEGGEAQKHQQFSYTNKD